MRFFYPPTSLVEDAEAWISRVPLAQRPAVRAEAKRQTIQDIGERPDAMLPIGIAVFGAGFALIIGSDLLGLSQSTRNQVGTPVVALVWGAAAALAKLSAKRWQTVYYLHQRNLAWAVVERAAMDEASKVADPAPPAPTPLNLPPLGRTVLEDGTEVIVDMEHDDYVEAVRRLNPGAAV